MIELPALKAHLGTDAVRADPDRDTVLSSLEAAAVDFVQRETGRYFGASTTFTEYIDGEDDREIWLNEPASSVTSVHERCDIGDVWEEIAEGDSDGWELRDARLLRKGGCVWERGSEYRVIYDFGYAAGSEPGEIRQLVTDLVAHRYRQRGIEGHASGKLGDYGFTSADLDAITGARQVLERWTWPGVGVG